MADYSQLYKKHPERIAFRPEEAGRPRPEWTKHKKVALSDLADFICTRTPTGTDPFDAEMTALDQNHNHIGLEAAGMLGTMVRKRLEYRDGPGPSAQRNAGRSEPTYRPLEQGEPPFEF